VRKTAGMGSRDLRRSRHAYGQLHEAACSSPRSSHEFNRAAPMVRLLA
jgi:hypothetical protein